MNRRLLITVVVTVGLLLAAIVLYRYSFSQLQAYSDAVEKTRETIYNFSRLNSLIKSLKIYARNYPESDNRDLLDRYFSARIESQERLRRLNGLVEDDSIQSKRVDSLNLTLNRFLVITDAQLHSGFKPVLDSLNRLAIEVLVKDMEPAVQRSILHEELVLKARKSKTAGWGNWLNVWVLTFILTALALLGVSIFSNYEQFKKRQGAEDFLNAILNTTQNGVVSYVPVFQGDEVIDFRVSFANRGVSNQLHREPEQLIGKTFLELWPSASREGSFERFVQVFRSGISEEFEVQSLDPQLKEWYHVSVTRMQEGLTVTFNNITSIKRYEAELQQKISELERTNEELEQFAYVSSHDLQEPLRKIEMFTTLTEQRYGAELTEEAAQYLHKIQQSSQRMRHLITDLLNYSRVTSEKEPFVKTDLNEVMKNVVTDFELKIEEKKAGLVVDPLPVIEAVPLQMNQLFQNLLSNSLKFTRPGRQPRISVRAERVAKKINGSGETSAHYCISWIDNGIGIEPQFADKVFTIFQRLHTRDEYEGTGIGLALCKKIATRHGGDITMEPNEDGGTVFRIILPAEQAT